jgi:Polyketide cyclase / dehydrase and lipid transport
MSRLTTATEIKMARAYYSTVLDQPADKVWSVIRAFDHYAWAGVPGQTIIEDARRGDQVGSIRRFSNGEKTIRQILLAHSDCERSYSYAFCEQAPFPVQHYQATIRVTPVVETNTAFVEWWATFDCAPEDHDRLIKQFETVWLGGLRQVMQAAAPR